MDTIGKRIRWAREKKGLTQLDIKQKTGISSGNLSDIEKDKSLPSAKALISLKRELDVSIDWLLTGEEPVQKELFVAEERAKYQVDELWPLAEQERDMLWKYRQLDDRDQVEIKEIVEMKYSRSVKRGRSSSSRSGGRGSGEEAVTKEYA